jgi:hypothetical protein
VFEPGVETEDIVMVEAVVEVVTLVEVNRLPVVFAATQERIKYTVLRKILNTP